MVPRSELDNLRKIMNNIEKVSVDKSIKCDKYVESTRVEMERMKVVHKNEIDELRIQSELKINDLEMKNRRQKERIEVFEKGFDFQTVL